MIVDPDAATDHDVRQRRGPAVEVSVREALVAYQHRGLAGVYVSFWVYEPEHRLTVPG
jgi:hypothetical protein